MPLFPLTFAGLWMALIFPEQPLKVSRMAAVADHVVLSRWRDGFKQRDADLAVWLSPYWVARNAPRQWSEARPMLNGKLTFAVRITGLEPDDPLELTGGMTPMGQGIAPTVSLEAEDGRGWTWNMASRIDLVKVIRSPSARAALAQPWVNAVLASLGPGQVQTQSQGQNKVMIYRVQAPICQELSHATRLRLRITQRDSVRTATFLLWPRINSAE